VIYLNEIYALFSKEKYEINIFNELNSYQWMSHSLASIIFGAIVSKTSMIKGLRIIIAYKKKKRTKFH